MIGWQRHHALRCDRAGQDDQAIAVGLAGGQRQIGIGHHERQRPVDGIVERVDGIIDRDLLLVLSCRNMRQGQIGAGHQAISLF